MTVGSFYRGVIDALNLDETSSVLVVCGGGLDASVLRDAGIGNAMITNVSYHAGVTDYDPYPWQFQDAENISLPDKSFDWVIVHAGLHHCASPHRALCEMLRVAKRGVLAIEARDSILMRAAVTLGLTYDFELEPALLSGGKYGGYRNTHIPNYIYRWTEREFKKTVISFVPDEEVRFEFRYGYALPLQRMAMSKNIIKRAATSAAQFTKVILERIAPRQGNCFAMVAEKTGHLKPWLRQEPSGVSVDLEYIANSRGYDQSKYRSSPAG